MKKLFYSLICIVFLAGCSIASTKGFIGKTDYRTFLILGEDVDENTVQYFGNRYDSVAWYTKSYGTFNDQISKTLTPTIGPNRHMKGLINELKSMNDTEGEWKLIIPDMAEDYFLLTLTYMKDFDLKDVKGQVFLVHSKGYQAIEQHVYRVSGGSLTVVYDEP